MRYKRYIASVLAVGLLLSAVGCGNKSEETTAEAVTEAVTEASQTDTSSAASGKYAVGDKVDKGPAAAEDSFSADASDGEEDTGVQTGDVIVDINFDDGDIDGFVTYTNGGECEISNADGELAVNVKKCGSLDYANQIYWDGFALSQGAVYTYSFDVHSDIDRKVEYRLQLNGGDYHAYTGEYIDVTSEPSHIEVEFEMTEDSDPAPRVVFNMGKMEDMSADPGEHNIYFDNIKLEVKDATNAQVVRGLPIYNNVAINQIGYAPADEKTAFVKSKELTDFYVCDASSQEVVYAGTLSESQPDVASGEFIQQGDFSDFSEEGTFYIYTEEGTSYPFAIGEGLYSEMYKDVVLMLYKQRCGTETDASIAEDFAHPVCHDTEATVYGTSQKKDVNGGWHDAGDYGRYTVSTAKTIADLMLAYEDCGVDADDMGIPESGNGTPDLLDEARFGLDWMMKMQDESTGGVYHKVTCLAFPESIMPQDETDELILSPISDAATGDFAAVMAKASRVYKDIDPEFSEKAYAAAEKAWDYLGAKVEDNSLKGFTNPEDVETGEYPDGRLSDEVYWAASELYISGRDDLKDVIDAQLADTTLKQGLGWADIGLYASYDLANSDTDLKDKGKEIIVAAADGVVESTAKDQYFMALKDNYPWGSNMTVANNGELLYMAYNLTEDDSYKKLAKRQLDYLMGANVVGYCYVTGFGTMYPQDPHHRPSEAVGKAMSGMLVGGPNNGLNDSYAKALLGEEAAAACYADNVQSYSTNEITIYWNSPLIYVLSANQ